MLDIVSKQDDISCVEDSSKRYALIEENLKITNKAKWEKEEKSLSNKCYDSYHKRMDDYLSSLRFKCHFYAKNRNGKLSKKISQYSAMLEKFHPECFFSQSFIPKFTLFYL